MTLRTEGELDEGPEADGETDEDEDEDGRADQPGTVLKKSADSEPSSSRAVDDSTFSERSDIEGDGSPRYREAKAESLTAEAKQRERDFRRQLNREAREIAAGSVHAGVKLIVHRPDFEAEHESEYRRLSRGLLPIVRETARKTLPLLEHDPSSEFARYRYDGGRFLADSVAYRDFRHFAKKRPPTDAPSLAVGLRVDESASMSAFGRLEAAKRAVIAVYEFCRHCRIPIMVYGDTADVSKLERMSIYAYADLHRTDPGDRYRLMGIRPRSNNRDGMALRIMAERLAAAPQKIKLLISISDGQPKAMDDYTGEYAVRDMQTTISEYERKGVAFLAAAIGHDKEVIHRIYGDRRYLDITDLNEFPARLVRTIARHL